MRSPLHTLHEEHERFRTPLARLLQTADAVGDIPVEKLRTMLDCGYAFLSNDLLPHSRAEETSLYPEVGRLLGSQEATLTMCQDHLVIAQLAAELAALRSTVTGEMLTMDQAHALRRVLYGLHALITAHFAKEEEIFLPLLERNLSHEQARRVCTMLRAGTHAAA